MIRHLIVSLALGLCALAAQAVGPQVELKTNQGNIVLELDAELAPKTVANFLYYVQGGHYNNTIFHRVIDEFMIQGGGLDANLQEKSTRAPVENEARNGLKNEPGTIAMARTAAPHSATAQFFINVGNNGFLDYPAQDGWGYAVFGKVVKGMDVVQKIAKLPTQTIGQHGNVPLKPVVIESATLIERAPEKAPENPSANEPKPTKPKKPAKSK
ncbi:MAG: peptidyl-prolyl cis-trans isomerase [Azoarcus sp.]|jgi:peptidyl-prolyl cis-trans isomerase A (cyclophilin A)|nr:peptidyl-prolyl cis-trans isomerase [Azoarcus sp.]